MLCPYVRSSSLNQFKACEMRYFLEYVLGMKNPTSKKACMGTIFHKVMEVRALAKIAMQCEKDFFVDDNFGRITIEQSKDIELILNQSFHYYSKQEPHIEFVEKDKRDVRKWIDNTLATWPAYDPFNLNIVSAELFFDIEVDKKWAKIKGEIGGKEIDGFMRIKGTMDMVIDLGNNVYELLDWKTGQYRKDFATNEEKTLDYLENDVQLLLYLIALKDSFPDKQFILSLAWINSGGIFSVYVDDEMMGRAWEMLEKSYKKISKTYNPKQLDPTHRDYRCKYLCAFAKKADYTGGKSICQYYKDQINKDGLLKVANKNIDMDSFGKYGTGGGRAGVETK